MKIEEIAKHYFKESETPQVRFIEHADADPVNELTLDLYRNANNSVIWYVLITSPGRFFISDPRHVIDVVHQTFMVNAVSWRVLNHLNDRVKAEVLPIDQANALSDAVIFRDGPSERVMYHALLEASTNSHPSSKNRQNQDNA